MSFLKALEHDLVVVGKAALIAAPIAGEVISFMNPPLGAAIIDLSGRVSAMVIQAEQRHSDSGAGPTRSAEVLAGFENVMQAVSEVTGKPWTYDKALLQKAVDAEVAALNAKAAWRVTVKEA